MCVNTENQNNKIYCLVTSGTNNTYIEEMLDVIQMPVGAKVRYQCSDHLTDKSDKSQEEGKYEGKEEDNYEGKEAVFQYRNQEKKLISIRKGLIEKAETLYGRLYLEIKLGAFIKNTKDENTTADNQDSDKYVIARYKDFPLYDDANNDGWHDCVKELSESVKLDTATVVYTKIELRDQGTVMDVDSQKKQSLIHYTLHAKKSYILRLHYYAPNIKNIGLRIQLFSDKPMQVLPSFKDIYNSQGYIDFVISIDEYDAFQYLDTRITPIPLQAHQDSVLPTLAYSTEYISIGTEENHIYQKNIKLYKFFSKATLICMGASTLLPVIEEIAFGDTQPCLCFRTVKIIIVFALTAFYICQGSFRIKLSNDEFSSPSVDSISAAISSDSGRTKTEPTKNHALEKHSKDKTSGKNSSHDKIQKNK